MPPEAAVAARNITEPGLLADMVAYSPDLTTEQRQELLETVDIVERLKLVSTFLARQIEILELKGKIQSEVKSEMDKTQREYFLREQLKAIQRELGEDDPQQAEINELREKVEHPACRTRSSARAQGGRPDEPHPAASPEVGVIRTYLDWLVGLPWNAPPTTSSTSARPRDPRRGPLRPGEDQGADPRVPRGAQAGERPCAVPILCFVGPAGRRQDLPRQVHRARPGPQVRPHEPGRRARRGRDPRPPPHLRRRAARAAIIQSIKQAGIEQPGLHARRGGQARHGLPRRPVLGAAGGPRPGAELHLPGPLPRGAVRPVARCSSSPPPTARPHPGRRCATAWRSSSSPATPSDEKLADRASDSSCPSSSTDHGLTAEADRDHRRGHARSSSGRTRARPACANLEREIATVCAGRRGRSPRVASREDAWSTRDARGIFLGPPRVRVRRARGRATETGVATGLAWTEVGGDILFVEATRCQGKGRLHPHRPARRRDAGVGAGGAGPASRANADDAGHRRRSSSSKNDMHVHVPAGAIPKDGPSAGITMATALRRCSPACRCRSDVAMTGEITLRGGCCRSAASREGPGRPPLGRPQWSSSRARTRRTSGTSRRRSQADQARPRRLHGPGPGSGPPAQADAASPARSPSRPTSPDEPPGVPAAAPPSVRRSSPADQPPAVA